MLWIALTGKNVWMCDYCLRRNVPIWAHYDEKVRPSIRQHTLKWRQELLPNAICIKIEWRTKHLLVDKLKSIVEVVCCSALYESTNVSTVTITFQEQESWRRKNVWTNPYLRTHPIWPYKPSIDEPLSRFWYANDIMGRRGGSRVHSLLLGDPSTRINWPMT